MRRNRFAGWRLRGELFWIDRHRYGLEDSLICVFLCVRACACENLDPYWPELCPCQAGIHHLMWTMRTDGESRFGKQLRPFHFGPGGMDHCRQTVDGPPATGHKAHSYPGPAAWGFKVRPVDCRTVKTAERKKKPTKNPTKNPRTREFAVFPAHRPRQANCVCPGQSFSTSRAG